MDSTNPTHMRFEDTCRVCLVKNKAFLDIFRFQNRNIPDEIYFATGVLINVSDNLPPNICVACLKELSVACNFKQKCLKADDYFRQGPIQQEDFGDHFDDNQYEYENNTYEVHIVKENSGISSGSNNFGNVSETQNQNFVDGIKIEKQDEFDDEMNKSESVHTIKSETIQIEIKSEIVDEEVVQRKQLCPQKEKKPISKEITIKKEGIRKKKSVSTPSEGAFECVYCGLTLAYKQSLCFHIHQKHVKEAKKLLCPICKQKCISADDLEEHLKEKPSIFSCEICPSKCHSHHTMWRHMKAKHAGVVNKPGKKGKYCALCNTIFDCLTEFAKHQQEMHNVAENVCSVCKQKFDNRNELANHMIQRNSIYSCEICPTKCHSKQTMWRHMRAKHVGVVNKPGKKGKYCALCNTIFDCLTEFAKHQQEMHNVTEFVCSVCKQKFDSSNELANHMIERKCVYSCEICPFKCHSKHTIWRHMRAKHVGVLNKPGKKGKYCALCNTIFDLTEFAKHQQEMHNVTELVCSVCKQKFDDRNELANHMIEKKSVYSCNKCPLKFHHKQTYWYHMTKKHDGVPKVPRKRVRICTICNASFNCLKEFKKHEQEVHEAKHVCEICGKQFGLAATLWQHRRIHGPAQLECDVCGYKTVNRTDLIKHLNIHSGENKFTCEYCSREFTFKHNLRAHTRRIHLKNQERKFKCTTCEKTFPTRHCLERHFAGHLGVKNFFCGHCSSSFLHYKDYKKHLKRQHNILLPNMIPGRKRANFVET